MLVLLVMIAVTGIGVGGDSGVAVGAVVVSGVGAGMMYWCCRCWYLLLVVVGGGGDGI